MDEIDVKILKHLFVDGRATYNSIADELKITGSAVRQRVNKLKEEGIIKGFMLDLNPTYLSLNRTVLAIRAPMQNRLDDVLDKILTIREVQYVIECLSSYILVDIIHDEPNVDNLANKILEISKGEAIEMKYTPRLTKVDKVVSKFDLKLLYILFQYPRASESSLANALGVSAKTIRRHMNYLNEIAKVRPIIEPGLIKDWQIIIAFMTFRTSPEQIIIKLKKWLLGEPIYDDKAAVLTMIFKSGREMDDALRDVKREIEDISVMVPVRSFYSNKPYVSRIEKVLQVELKQMADMEVEE